MNKMDSFLNALFHEGSISRKITIGCRIVIANLLFMLLIMAFLSRNDTQLYNALIWFGLPLLILGGLDCTNNLENPILRFIRKVVLVLWWVAMIVGIVYTIIHFSDPCMAKAFGGFLFLILSGVFTITAGNER